MKYFGHKRTELDNKVTLSFWTNWVVDEEAWYYNEALYQKLYEQHSTDYSLMDDECKHIIQQSIHIDFLENYFEGFYHICPQEILDMVADKRVLAMGTLTQETLEAINKLSEEAEKELALLQKKFHMEYENVLSILSPQAKEALMETFHDARLFSYEQQATTINLILRLDNGSDNLENQYIKLTFLQSKVMEGTLQDSLHVWIHHELYYENGHFELHVAFSGGNIIIQFDDLKGDYFSSYLTSDTPLPELENNEMFVGKARDLIKREINLDDAYRSLSQMMNDEDALDQDVLYLKDENSRGKLTIQKCENSLIETLTNRKNCYLIEFINEWRMFWENRASMLEEPEKRWIRGAEIHQYINDNLKEKLDLWMIWSDHNKNIQYETLPIEDFTLNYLEELYKETTEGIVVNRCITLIR